MVIRFHELPDDLANLVMEELLRFRVKKDVGKIVSEGFRDGDLRPEAYAHMGDAYMKKHL